MDKKQKQAERELLELIAKSRRVRLTVEKLEKQLGGAWMSGFDWGLDWGCVDALLVMQIVDHILVGVRARYKEILKRDIAPLMKAKRSADRK